MRIAYCISGTYNSGGMERVLANKANYLAGHGAEVLIITTDQQSRKPFFALDPRILHRDLDINYFSTLNMGLLQKIGAYLFKQRKHESRLKKVLEEYQADLVVSMFDHDVSFLHRIPDGSAKILEIHFSRFKRLQYGRKGLWGLVDQWRSARDLSITKKYDRFVVLTREDSEHWGPLPNLHVIPNAASFKPEERAPLEAKQVIAVGRYDEQKDFEELIYIWQSLRDRFPDWSLRIFGNGPQQEKLAHLIDQLQLSDVVFLNPPVLDIQKAYFNSAVLAMTSRYEGLPMALLEAQACGLPLVSYACKCGPRDIILHGKTGFLIEEGDRLEFSVKLGILMENERLRKLYGENARQRAAMFTETHVMQRWLALFEQTLKEKRAELKSNEN